MTLSVTEIVPGTPHPRARILYAKRGELVTCTAGHPVCEIGRDLPLDKKADFSKDLVRFRGKKIKNKATSGCLVCGSLWVVGQGGSGTLHFESGWRYIETVPFPKIVHSDEIVRF